MVDIFRILAEVGPQRRCHTRWELIPSPRPYLTLRAAPIYLKRERRSIHLLPTGPDGCNSPSQDEIGAPATRPGYVDIGKI